MNIQDLLDRFEAFKLKGLQLNEQDIHDWLDLRDEINDTVIELESKYLEWEAMYERDYWLRLVELKEIKLSDGKKKYTDATARGRCDDEFFDRRLEQIITKETQKRLQKKAELCEHYINAVKLYLKKNFTI